MVNQKQTNDTCRRRTQFVWLGQEGYTPVVVAGRSNGDIAKRGFRRGQLRTLFGPGRGNKTISGTGTQKE